MNGTARKLDDLEWVGGHPALHFVNTVHAWVGGKPGEEYLLGYDQLLDWHKRAGLVDARGRRALARSTAAAQDAALAEAKALRRSLHRLFRSVSHGRAMPKDALDHLGEIIRRTVGFRRLAASGGRLVCRWDFSAAPAGAVLGPVAWQAVDLLERGPTERIKECPFEEGCGWLFLDSSRNRSRTWCSMKTCGNIAKVKRFRARKERSA